MRIVSWNINGLNATAEAVSHYLRDRRPDVLCLNEIKVGRSSLSKIFPSRFHPDVVDAYTVFWNPAQRGGWHGVAVFVRREHAARVLDTALPRDTCLKDGKGGVDTEGNPLPGRGWPGNPRYPECTWYDPARAHLTPDKPRATAADLEAAHAREGRLLAVEVVPGGGEGGPRDEIERTEGGSRAGAPPLVVVATYVPNSGCDWRVPLRRLHYRTHHWDPDMFAYLGRLAAEHDGRVVWCGDLNVAHHPEDVSRPDAFDGCAGFTLEERASLDAFLKSAPFYDVWREAHPGVRDYSFYNIALNPHGTAPSGRAGWRLDYFIAHESLRPRVRSVAMDLAADKEFAIKGGWVADVGESRDAKGTQTKGSTKPKSKHKRHPRVSDHIPIELNLDWK